VPQLNFQVPDQLLARIDAAKPDYLDRKGFLCLLLDQALTQALDRPVTLITEGAAEVISKAVTSSSAEEKELKPKTNTRARDAFSRKQLPPGCVPDDLADCIQLLEEFWFVKKGTRSERAWNRLINKLRTFSEKDRLEALQAACNAGWADVYEPKPPLINGKPAQPELKHPAAREFRGGRFVDEPTTNPALENLF
jgi:hypothetical protein